MKKLILLIAAMCITISASAQFYVGAKAGLAASWTPRTVIVGDETILPHNGFTGGAVVGYDFGDTFCVESGVLFAAKGHSDRRPIVGKYSRNLNYVILPLMGGLRFGDGKFSLLVGPEFGFLTKSMVNEGGIKYEDTEVMNNFNILIAGELHYMFLDSLGATLRVESGLNRNFVDEDLLKKDKATNLTVSLGLFYKFEFDL